MATPEEMAQKMIANLPERTGRSLEEWLVLLADRETEKHGQIVKYLKGEHAVTHGFANLIAHCHLDPSYRPGAATSEEDLVATQYSGAKEALLPIYRTLVEAVEGFGQDVELAPKKAYVSLRRRKQFGLVQPSTRTRVDVGLVLRGVPAGERLEAAGSFNSMVTHRVRLQEVSEVDDELRGWLRQAYEEA